jgi:hypothetical protein
MCHSFYSKRISCFAYNLSNNREWQNHSLYSARNLRNTFDDLRFNIEGNVFKYNGNILFAESSLNCLLDIIALFQITVIN